MLSAPMRRLAVPLGLLALIMIACSGNLPTSPYDTAGKDKAVAKEALEGKEFNKFFPKASAPFDMVAKQDKKGASIYELKKDGKVVASLSITDTVSEPDAKDKFKNSTEKINGYPSGSESSLETAILVADRFQVKVRTMPPATNATFGKADREEWIKKFDLDGLAKLGK
jgi:hypothetical protein